jgi:hypothetical protein
VPWTHLHFNREAFTELKVADLAEQVAALAPGARDSRGNVPKARSQVVTELFLAPIADRSGIAERQQIFADLKAEATRKAFTDAIALLEQYRESLRENDIMGDVVAQNLRRLTRYYAVVELAKTLSAIPRPASATLGYFWDLAQALRQDARFQEAENFINTVDRRFGLVQAMSTLKQFTDNFLTGLKPTSHKNWQLAARRQYVAALEGMAHAVGHIRSTPGLTTWFSNEADWIEAASRLDSTTRSLFPRIAQFHMWGPFARQAFKGHAERIRPLLEYWSELALQAMAARVPEIDIGALPELLAGYVGIARLQDRFAKYGSTTPAFPANFPKDKINILDAHNAVLAGKGVTSVANDFQTSRRHHIYTVSGPNNGGKTTFLRTSGLIAWLAHMGMDVPARTADMAIRDGIYSSIDEGDDLAHGAGKYRAKLLRVRDIIFGSETHPGMTPSSLVLLDEPSNGTDATEGLRMTMLMAEHASAFRVPAIITSHQQELFKLVAEGNVPGAANYAAQVELRNGEVAPTWKIRPGIENSFGEYVAREVGLTKDKLAAHRLAMVAGGRIPAAETRIKLRGPKRRQKTQRDDAAPAGPQ